MTVDLGLDDYVTFTGWVNDQVIVPVLNTADVAVCPDPYNTLNDKLTMNKVMEYMALGKPIVQYDLTESRYSAGDAAVYAKRNCAIDLGDKILGLLDDPESREAMGKLGRRRIETVLAWEHQAPVLLSAYESLGWPSGIPVTQGKRQTDPIA
jgi:glycosyltransferase involved in cell wall biosynthesis